MGPILDLRVRLRVELCRPPHDVRFGVIHERTTGTINPGLIYVGDTYQLAVEAIIPVNRASGDAPTSSIPRRHLSQLAWEATVWGDGRSDGALIPQHRHHAFDDHSGLLDG
jgi:hypothetical protein